MGKTSIEWTNQVWNPTTGCTKISTGCAHCYAEQLWPRLAAPGQPYEGRKFTDVRCHNERLLLPLQWQRPKHVFVDSMSDLFHPDVPFEFIAAVFGTMSAGSHIFQVLTKRPARMLEYFKWASKTLKSHDAVWRKFAGSRLNQSGTVHIHKTATSILPNVQLGVSIEDPMTANERIPLLLQTPAAVRFLSMEPMLEPIDLVKTIGGSPNSGFAPVDGFGRVDGENPTIHWVILGGESGPRARPMHPQWARLIRDQCVDAAIPFFFKSWGSWKPLYSCTDIEADELEKSAPTQIHMMPATNNDHSTFRIHELHTLFKVGKKKAGRTLDGRQWEQYPDPCAGGQP